MRFVTERVPTKQRATSCIGSKELIIYEPAVMLAMALWMFELEVVAKIKGERYFVEAKGGCINSSYAGILSKLRSNLYEAIGSLLKAPAGMDRLIAAVPCCGETKKLAVAMSERCRKAGLEIALVSPDGQVHLKSH